MKKQLGRYMFLCFVACVLIATLLSSHLDFSSETRLLLTSVGVSTIALWFIGCWEAINRIERVSEALLNKLQTLSAGRLQNTSNSIDATEMERALSVLRTRTYDVVAGVRNGVSGFALTSGLLSKDNQALLLRTERQSALLESTATSTEEITSTVKQNAENVEKANQMISAAAQAALKGGEAIAGVETTMAEIRGSSRKIADIIDVIDGIAFQTNILALNAAVEAARAGDSGRGFAVVAVEVRVLAQRVATASKEIQSLINDSVTKVQSGDQQVRFAASTIQKIVTSVTSAATVMEEISNSSREQSIGVDMINETISQLDCMTQENATLVDEIAVSAGNLHRQAVTLTNIVSHFNLGTGEFGNKEDAVALIDTAIAYADHAGLDDLIDEVNDLTKRRFSDRDLYLVIVSLEGRIIAHGGNPRLLNNDTTQQRDADGKPFGQAIVNMAKRQGTGWVDFKFAHPVTQEIKSKSAYVKRMGDCLISCGFYLH